MFAPPVSWLRECVAASKHPSRLLLVPRGAPGWAPKQALLCLACSCVESTTHRDPSDNDILESVNPLKLSSVECHLPSLLCPERGMCPGGSEREQLLEEAAEVTEK